MDGKDVLVVVAGIVSFMCLTIVLGIPLVVRVLQGDTSAVFPLSLLVISVVAAYLVLDEWGGSSGSGGDGGAGADASSEDGGDEGGGE